MITSIRRKAQYVFFVSAAMAGAALLAERPQPVAAQVPEWEWAGDSCIKKLCGMICCVMDD